MEEFSLGLGLSLLAVICVIILGFKVFISKLQKKHIASEETVVLAVQVFKENEVGPIAFEQIFSTLYGIQHDLSWWQKLKGLTLDKVSFEIAHINKSIKFYIWVPKKLQNLIEGQIYAQYPNVEIMEVPDYARTSPLEISKKPPETVNPKTDLMPIQSVANIKASLDFEKYQSYKNAIGAELTLEEPEIYPIKRYPQFEDKLTRMAVDPVAGLTASLSKLRSGSEEAWIQMVIQPLEKKWKNIFVNCIRLLNKGLFLKIERLQHLYTRLFINRKKWPRRLLFPLYILFWFQGLTSGMSKKSLNIGDKNSSENDNELIEEMSRSHERETNIGAALDKVVKLLFKVTIRVVYIPHEKNLEIGQIKIREISGAFKQFNVPHLNGFTLKKLEMGENIIAKYQNRAIEEDNMVLNVEELATIYHLPSKIVATPNIYWVRSRKMEPPADLPNEKNAGTDGLSILGKTNYRNQHELFGIKTSDRRRHFYVIGKTGMGKSTLLENMLFSDIQAGRGVAVVDPHGDLADAVLRFIPSNRTNEVVIFDPSDVNHPVAFNMLENIDPTHNSIVCSGLVGIFKKIYAESWGPRLEHFLRNTILALLEYPNTTMLGITRMLQDWNFRKKVVRNITDPIVRAFWLQEFEKMQERQRIEAISPILNKVGQFLASPIIRNIVGQPKSAIDLRFAMDKGKIVIVNLSKGKIGEDNSALLGSMMITKFQLDAMSRANIRETERKDFYLYVDEFQNFATDSFATILSEARKYKLNLTMANQYIAQMPEEVRDAVFGNVGSILSFQVGPTDAEFLVDQFGGEDNISINDLVSLNKYTAYLKLLVDGMPTPTFSIDTLPAPELTKEDGRLEKIIQVARERYSKPREMVEDKINRWSKNLDEELEEREDSPDTKKIKEPKIASKLQSPQNKAPVLNLSEPIPEEIPIVSKEITVPKEESKQAIKSPSSSKTIESKNLPQKPTQSKQASQEKTVPPPAKKPSSPSPVNVKPINPKTAKTQLTKKPNSVQKKSPSQDQTKMF